MEPEMFLPPGSESFNHNATRTTSSRSRSNNVNNNIVPVYSVMVRASASGPGVHELDPRPHRTKDITSPSEKSRPETRPGKHMDKATPFWQLSLSHHCHQL